MNLKKMALPKKHNQLKKREKSLKELTFYKIEYDYTYTNRFRESLKDGDESCLTIAENITGLHEFSALNDNDADRKTNTYLSGLVGNDILQSYTVKKVESEPFIDRAISKGLGEYLNLK